MSLWGNFNLPLDKLQSAADTVSMTYREHIEKLADREGITLDVFDSDAGDILGWAYHEARKIELTHCPDSSEWAYLTALHEIGHIVNGPDGSQWDKELAAWQWARENSIVALCDYLEMEIDVALATHRQKG